MAPTSNPLGSPYYSSAIASAITLPIANCYTLSDLAFTVLTNRITKRFRDPINHSMSQFVPTPRRVPFPGNGPSFHV